MKKSVFRAAAFLLLSVLSLASYGQGLFRYAETVNLAGDGSAAIRLLLEFRGREEPRLLIPVRYKSLRNLEAKRLSAGSLRLVEKDGNRFLALDMPPAAAAPTVEISFTVDDYFKSGGSPGAFGNRDLRYRFVNVPFAVIEKFTAEIVLPPGRVFNALSRFSPQPEKAGMIAPFTISRVGGRIVGRIVVDRVGLGDEIALDCTFRIGRRSKLLLVILVVLALAYLFFFRDVLVNGKKAAAAGPKS